MSRQLTFSAVVSVLVMALFATASTPGPLASPHGDAGPDAASFATGFATAGAIQPAMAQ